ncbi:MAG: phenylacetate-CoA oxygenase subunit PaaJ [Saprospiraceae bacterium]|nr:phenylacetate-CoA oxygenase subunit PaaJ [Saprospiraceae bacterium]
MKIKEILAILNEVTDPEIPVITIEELGILREVKIDEKSDTINVYITPTYSGCPAMDMITVQIKSSLQEHGYSHVNVISLLEPAWTTDWISDTGRKKLMAYGISPPVQKTTDSSFLSGKSPIVQCPVCKSFNTEMISRFGSTPCKSLYKCLECLEPFDYFKCH